MTHRTCLGASVVLIAVTATAGAQQPRATPPATFDQAAVAGAMRYRMIGPARGGRVTAVAGVAQRPRTFYFGSTGGGVWKTENGGISWANVSEPFFRVSSIGAVRVADSDPDVVWVGTGSEGIRSNVSIGRGVYRSTDAGRTWRFAGLREAGQIGAIVVHPTNPQVAWVAAVGNPFAPNHERGVYKTTDGGTTWTQVLYVSDSTGAVDLELQPGNPNTIYASMWRGERKPWTIISGAREGGVYRSTDGGTSWTKLGGGLPNELVGKSDLAVSAAAPNRVYALVEAKPGGGLYRSNDAGTTWTLANGAVSLVSRPFYYTNVDASPTNADVVYVSTEAFAKSTDGGKTFRPQRTPHGDNHDLWINPADADVMIQSNDGGANVTFDGGRSWSTQLNQPTAEIYQVATDDQYPYRVYGAQQDNSTVIVPSLPITAGSLDDPLQEWHPGPGCETGPIIPHPTNPDTVYGGCKGQFSRMSMRTGQERQYWVGGESLYGNPNSALTYRFQRVSPMEVSPNETGTVYYGSQYLHRSRDGGITWSRISPDLTANDPRYRDVVSGTPITIDVTGEEMYATLYAIRESPLARGLIWTGANDGPVHVTRDGGATWADVTPKDLPPGGRVQNVEPSPHHPGSAYVTVLRYLLGDFEPYAYKTDDYGRTWRRLTTGTNGIPADEPVRVVREDAEREGLLYAGTEFGVYVSFDDGGRWSPLQLNLPVTPVTDLRVKRGDLVVATQGRSFWILDDLAPLRALSASTAGARAALVRPREAIRYRYRTAFGGIEGNGAGGADQPEYPPPGAMIDYWLREPASATIEIRDARGALVRRFTSSPNDTTAAAAGTAPLTMRAGLNRVVWDMTWPGPWSATRAGRGGPMAAPGRYTVRLSVGDSSWTETLVLRADPRAVRDGMTPALYAAQVAHELRARDLVSDVNHLVEGFHAGRARLVASSLPPDAVRRLDAFERALVTPPVRYSQPGLQTHVTYLYSTTIGADQPIGRDAVLRLSELRRQVDARAVEVRAVLGAKP